MNVRRPLPPALRVLAAIEVDRAAMATFGCSLGELEARNRVWKVIGGALVRWAEAIAHR